MYDRTPMENIFTIADRVFDILSWLCKPLSYTDDNK